MTEHGRVHYRKDNNKWQAHDVYGAYVGQFTDADEAKEILKALAKENEPESNESEVKDAATSDIEKKKAAEQMPIRGSDSMLEVQETPAPWTLPGRDKKSRGEKIAEDANWVLRKSKNAYWAVGGVAALGTLTALAGVWGKS